MLLILSWLDKKMAAMIHSKMPNGIIFEDRKHLWKILFKQQSLSLLAILMYVSDWMLYDDWYMLSILSLLFYFNRKTSSISNWHICISFDTVRWFFFCKIELTATILEVLSLLILTQKCLTLRNAMEIMNTFYLIVFQSLVM